MKMPERKSIQALLWVLSCLVTFGLGYLFGSGEIKLFSEQTKAVAVREEPIPAVAVTGTNGTRFRLLDLAREYSSNNFAFDDKYSKQEFIVEGKLDMVPQKDRYAELLPKEPKFPVFLRLAYSPASESLSPQILEGPYISMVSLEVDGMTEQQLAELSAGQPIRAKCKSIDLSTGDHDAVFRNCERIK
jgi:hypothetical protein